MPNTRPQIDFRIIHLSLLRLQTPLHKPDPDTGYRINFDPLMRRPCRWDEYIKMLITPFHGFTKCYTTSVLKPTSHSAITNIKEKNVYASLMLGPLYTADTAKTAGTKQGRKEAWLISIPMAFILLLRIMTHLSPWSLEDWMAWSWSLDSFYIPVDCRRKLPWPHQYLCRSYGRVRLAPSESKDFFPALWQTISLRGWAVPW